MGGSQRVTWDACQGLAARGHRVTAWTTALPGGATELEVDGVSIRALPGTRPDILDRAWWQATAALRPDADVLLSGGVAGAHVRGLPTLAHLQDVHLHATGRVGRSGRVRLDPRHLDRWAPGVVARECRLLRHAGAVAVSAPSTRAALDWLPYRAAHRPARTAIVHNGVEPSRFRPDAAARRRQRAAWGIPDGAPLVLTVARLTDKKGLDHAIAAVAAARRRRPGLRHVIVGAGPDERRLRAFVLGRGLAGAVRLDGFVPDADLPSAYHAADAFLFTPWGAEVAPPLNVLEAVAAGLPVAAPPHVLVPDLPRAFAAPSGDVRAQADALLRALAAGRGAPHLPQRFTREAFLDGLEARLRDAAG